MLVPFFTFIGFFYRSYIAGTSVLGSILAWAIMARTCGVSNPMVKTLMALGSAYAMIKTKRQIVNRMEGK